MPKGSKFLTLFSLEFLVLWLVVFAAFFAGSLCSPTVPYLLKEFLTQEAAVVAMIGYLSSLLTLARTVNNVLGAVLADKIERGAIILISLGLLPLSFLLLWFATDTWWVLASYLFFGFVFGLSMPSFNAIVADLAKKSNRATVFAVFNLSWIIAQILAPVIGGLLSDNFFLRLPFIAAFFVSVMTFLTYTVYFKKMHRNFPNLWLKPYKNKESINEVGYSNYFRKNLYLLCSAQFFSGFSNGVFLLAVTAFLMYSLKASPTGMGVSFSLGWGVATALAQIPGGKVSDKFGFKTTIISFISAATPFFLLLPLSTTLLQFTLVFTLLCFIGNLSTPALSAWIANLFSARERGRGYGLTSAAWGVGAVIGPATGSIVWTLSKPNYLIPFIAAAALLLSQLPLIASIRD